MTNDTAIQLTRLPNATGCAAKHPPGFLLPLLGMLPPVTDQMSWLEPRLLTTRPFTKFPTTSRRSS